MSRIHEKSPKHCAEKQALTLHKFKKKLLLVYFPALFFLAILLLVLLVWLILHPSKPRFSLQQAHLTTAPVSAHNSTSLHLTLVSHNPNKRVGIYYHQFLLHASYKGQNITPDTSIITPFYQGHKETNPLSTVLNLVGHWDRSRGNMVLGLRVSGQLSWKVGTWVSGKYRFSVGCDSIATVGTTLHLPPVNSEEGTKCSTWM